MVYVTGDFHGEYKRFSAPEYGRLKKGDTLIVCGDFGFVWENTDKEKKQLKKIGKKTVSYTHLVPKSKEVLLHFLHDMTILDSGAA